MSKLYWAGIAIGPPPHAGKWADKMNDRISAAISGPERQPIKIEIVENQFEINRHMFDGAVICDFFDRFGSRVGFGVRAEDEGRALELIDHAIEVLGKRHTVVHGYQVGAWSWDSAAVPVAQPEPIAAW